MNPGGVDVRCGRCGERLRARMDTNGMGGLLELVEPCPKCTSKPSVKAKRQRPRKPEGPRPRPGETPEEAQRRRDGICRWCDRPVEGRKRMAAFCVEHRRIHYWLKRHLRRRHPLKVENGQEGKLRHGHCERCGHDFDYRKRGPVPSLCPGCNDELEAFAKKVGYDLRRK